MKPAAPTGQGPPRKQMSASKSAKPTLQEVLRRRALVGDPRVRVEVPTAKPTAKQSARHSSKRYHIG